MPMNQRRERKQLSKVRTTRKKSHRSNQKLKGGGDGEGAQQPPSEPTQDNPQPEEKQEDGKKSAPAPKPTMYMEGKEVGINLNSQVNASTEAMDNAKKVYMKYLLRSSKLAALKEESQEGDKENPVVNIVKEVDNAILEHIIEHAPLYFSIEDGELVGIIQRVKEEKALENKKATEGNKATSEESTPTDEKAAPADSAAGA